MKIINCILLILLFVSCGLEEDLTVREYPYIQLEGLSSLNETGININFKVLKEGKVPISSYGVEYVNGQSFSRDVITSEISGKPKNLNVSYRLDKDILAGANYTCRPFVKAGDHTVYGEEATFISRGGRAPVIYSISPNTLSENAEYTLTGDYFSTLPYGNKVELLTIDSYYTAVVTYSSNKELKFKVYRTNKSIQGGSHSYSLKVTSNNKSVTKPDAFKISNPYIEDVTPLKGHVGSKVFMKVNFMSSNVKDLLFHQTYFATFSPTPKGDVFEGRINDLGPGIYEVSITNGNFHHSYRYSYEILNSWKVYKEGFSEMPTPLPERKHVLGDRILHVENGSNRSIYLYNYKTEELTKMRDREGPFPNRSVSLSVVFGNRFLYTGLGFRYTTDNIEDLKDMRRLDLVKNEWEKLPDLPLEKSWVTKAFEYEGKIVVVFNHYLNYFYLDPYTNEWQDSKQPVHSLFRSAYLYVVDGEDIYIHTKSGIYRYRIGFEPVLITETYFGYNPPSMMVKNKNELLLTAGSKNIYMVDIEKGEFRKIQPIFSDFSDYIYPFVFDGKFLLGYPRRYFDKHEKNIIYELNLDN